MKKENLIQSHAALQILRKKPLTANVAHTANLIMKAYFIFATCVSAVSFLKEGLIAIPIVGQITGCIWNFIDSAMGSTNAIAEINLALKSKSSRKVKLALALSNLSWSSIGMPLLTTIALLSAGVAAAMAASSFAFAIGAFIIAVNSTREYCRASHKLDSVFLLQDRLNKFEVLQTRINECKDSNKNKKLERELKRIKAQAHSLYQFNLDNNKIENNNHCITSACLKDFNYKNTNTRLAEFLLKKQALKQQQRKIDAFANHAAGIGALLTGLALFAPPLAGAAIACYAVAAIIKLHQLWQRYSNYSTRSMCYKNKDKAQVKRTLIREFMHDDKFDLDTLSKNDQDLVTTLQSRVTLFRNAQTKTAAINNTDTSRLACLQP